MLLERKQTAFTDTDLEWMRTVLCRQRSVGPRAVEALIVRLEAAELALKVFRELESEKSSYDDAVSLYNEWRKVAGK